MILYLDFVVRIAFPVLKLISDLVSLPMGVNSRAQTSRLLGQEEYS